MSPSRGTVRDTITMRPEVAEQLRDLTAWAHHHGQPRATKGDIVAEALDLLAERWADAEGVPYIPGRGGYDLRYGPRDK